jgi:hypothetical protein
MRLALQPSVDERSLRRRPLSSCLRWFGAWRLPRVSIALLVAAFCWCIGPVGNAKGDELRQLFQSASNPYQYKGKFCFLKPDFKMLQRLKDSSDARVRDMAEQRLRIESLKKEFIQTDKEAASTIQNKVRTTVEENVFPQRLAIEILKQRAQADRSFENLLLDAFREPLEDVHVVSMTEHQKVALASLAGLEADKRFRKSVDDVLEPRDAAAPLTPKVDFGFGYAARTQAIKFRAQNHTQTALHNCVIVLNVHSDPTLYPAGEAVNEAFAAGLMTMFGFNPMEDAKLSFLMRVNATADRGGFAFVPVLDKNTMVVLDVDDARRFASRVTNADVSFSCDEFCLKHLDVPLKSVRSGVTKNLAKGKKQAAKKGTRRQQQQD